MKTHSLRDACIRPALRALLINQYMEKENEATLIEELGLCQGRARVDIALVKNELHGYEIKSDRDSLTRLDRQIEIYNRIFDQVTLVVGGRHLIKALEIIPKWWGVLQVHPSPSEPFFDSIRKPRQNPSRDARSIVELLWHEEAINLLEQHNSARGVKSKPRRAVWDRVCETFSIDEISEIVREKLKTRVKPQALSLQ